MTLKQYNSHKNYCNQDHVYCGYCNKRFSNPKYLKAHCKSKHLEEETWIDNDLDATSHAIQIEKGIMNQIENNTLGILHPETQPIIQLELEPTVENLEDYLTDEHQEEVTKLDEIEYKEIDSAKEETTVEVIFDELTEQENQEEIVEYRCTLCTATSTTLDELIDHMNLRHKECDSECSICHKMFTKQSLQRHMRYHDKKNICPKCGRGFSEPSLLKAHMDRKFSCLGPTLEELQQDPTYMKKMFPCDLCFYRGATKSNLSRHVRNNHYLVLKEIECPDCGKELTRQQWQSHRKTHMKVKCHICNKWLSSSKFFKVHLENHAKPANKQQKATKKFNISPQITGGAYNCPECNFQTKERRLLVQHLKVRHAPKDFECQFEECIGKKFTQTQLRLHQRFHRLAFKCEKCGTGFPDNRDLKRHTDGKKCHKIRKSRMLGKETKKEVFVQPRKIKIEFVEIEKVNEDNLNDSTGLVIKLEPQTNTIEKDSLSSSNVKKSHKKYKQSPGPLPSPITQIEVEYNPCQDSISNTVGIYECMNCNYETDEKAELIEHWNQFHAPRDQPCPEPQCYGKLFSKAQLNLHMRFHMNTTRHSKNCKKSLNTMLPMEHNFNQEKVLLKSKKLQISNMSENAWIYSCSGKYQSCNFMTLDKKLYDRHRANFHNFEAPSNKNADDIICNEIDFASNSASITVDHVNVLQGSNKRISSASIVLQCTECDFETNKAVYLQQHVLMNHAAFKSN